MATSGPTATTTNKEEDVRHTCSLCMEPYRGRRPKLLPCYHTFCLPCLTALEASVRSAKRNTTRDDDLLGMKETARTEQPLNPKGDEEEQKTQPCKGSEGTSLSKDASLGSDDVTTIHDDVTASRDDVDRGSFPCPACRAPVPIPVGGVAALQTNFYVDHEPGPDEALPSVLCDMCEEDNRHHATHTCQECRVSLCRTCRRCHDVFTRDHHVTPVGLGQPAKQQKQEGRGGLCLIHQDQTFCFYCRQCDVSICLHCRLTSHEGHNTVDLVSAALQAREEITSLIPTAQQQLQVLDISMQQVDSHDRQLTRHVQEVTQHIRARYDALRTWARQSRDRLMEEVSAKEASTRGQLQAEKASSALTRDTLSTALSRAARATAADPHLAVMLRKELKAALLPDDKLNQHHSKQPADGQGCSWGYDVTGGAPASLLLDEDDVRAYMGRVEGEGSVDADQEEEENRGTPVSSRRQLERWMKEVTDNIHTLTSQLSSCADDVTTLQTKGDELQKKGEQLEKKTDELEKKGNELQKKGNELQKKGNELEKKGNELEKKGDELQKKGNELQKKGNELLKQGSELQSKGDKFQSKGDRLQSKVDELQKKGDELEKKMSSLQDEVTATRKTEANLLFSVQSIKDSFGKAKRMFIANDLEKDKTKKDKAMIFKTIDINEGGHYNVDTGVFTVPYTGLYFFTVHVESTSDKNYVYGQIKVHGDPYTAVYGGYGGGSGCSLIPLTAGQKVWAKATDCVPQFYYAEETWFRGTLVLPFP